MGYSATAVYMCMKYFDEMGWEDYRTEEVDGDCFLFRLTNFDSKSKLQNFGMTVGCRKTDITVDVWVLEDVPVKRAAEMGSLIDYINDQYRFMKFVLSDDNLYCQMTTDFDGGMLSEQMLHDTINFPLQLMQKEGNAIYDVLMGLKTAEQSIQAYDI